VQDGIEIVAVYSDQASRTGKKPGIEQLMRDAQNGKFRALYVYALRKLNNHPDAALEITKWLEASRETACSNWPGFSLAQWLIIFCRRKGDRLSSFRIF
jgi:hypothetical protein